MNTFADINYSFASSRPYHDISLNITYLARLFSKECIIHMNITNLFGFRNVFGYRYSGIPGKDGHYISRAVVPATGRQAILLMMISL